MYEKESLEYALRERGNTPEQVAQMTPEEKFTEYCNWHGLINWAPTLIKIWRECQT